ncbi:MAG: hypothetical protein AAF552_00120 [Pseudomonadota bacterium]
MKLAWIELGIAGTVLGLALLELYNLRRLRLQREREEQEKPSDEPPPPEDT